LVKIITITVGIVARDRHVALSRLDASRTIHLLQNNSDGEFGLTTFFTDKIPQKYAIPSHTWEAEEVTFEDLQNRTSRKAGYNKIRFCGEQARRDGLQYFWVDTCCTDQCVQKKIKAS
jgi:hypothetical protein